MAALDAKKVYRKVREGDTEYNEEEHCVMVIRVMNTFGTVPAFCREAMIGQTTFYRWTERHPVFKQCYDIGKVIARTNWEKEGEDNKDNPDFNFKYWKEIGAERYGLGKNRVRVGTDHEAAPYEQYKQLMMQAADEEFNASEIKQIMEAINVGIRAHESYELQRQLNEMKRDVESMKVESISANDEETTNAYSRTNKGTA